MTDFNSGTRVKRWKLLRISFFYNKALSFSISNSAVYGWGKLGSLFLFYIRLVVCRGTPVSSVHVPWVKVGSEWDGTWTSAFIFETKWLNLTASNEKTWKKTTFICTCNTSNSYAIFYVINKYLKKKKSLYHVISICRLQWSWWSENRTRNHILVCIFFFAR